MIGYRTILGSEAPELDADLILKQLDNNNSGTIDYTGKIDEFLAKSYRIRYCYH